MDQSVLNHEECELAAIPILTDTALARHLPQGSGASLHNSTLEHLYCIGILPERE